MHDKTNVADVNLSHADHTRSLIRVLMICDTLPPIEGGIENHVQNLAKQLSRRFKVYLVGSKLPVTMPSHEICDGVEIYRISTGRFSSLRLLLTGLSLARKNGIHLIHVHSLGQLSIIAGIIGKILSRPVIVTVHESQFILKMRSDHPSVYTLFLYYVPMMLANAIITPSAELRQYVVSMVGQERDVREICNGVDLDLFKPASRGSLFRRKYSLGNAKVILCPRRITPKNGIIHLVQAIPRVAKEERNFRFVFAGPVRNQGYFLTIKKWVKENGIEPYVRFTRGIPYHLMPKLYAASDIVVIPSLIEATSLAALEAMASAKPVVASAVGGLLEIVKHGINGFLVKPGDSDDLAKVIIRLLRNHDAVKRLGHHGLLIAQDFSWESVAQKVTEMYKSTIKQYKRLRLWRTNSDEYDDLARD